MIRKDYELIAGVINKSELSETKKVMITVELTEALSVAYDNFKEDAFMKACVPNINEYNL